jgi:hypothetical protein
VVWQNNVMARGWESKELEDQTEDVQEPMAAPSQTKKSAEEIQKDREKQGLELSRKRIVHDLESATHPNHRKTLEAALAHLDQKLGELE